MRDVSHLSAPSLSLISEIALISPTSSSAHSYKPSISQQLRLSPASFSQPRTQQHTHLREYPAGQSWWGKHEKLGCWSKKNYHEPPAPRAQRSSSAPKLAILADLHLREKNSIFVVWTEQRRRYLLGDHRSEQTQGHSGSVYSREKERPKLLVQRSQTYKNTLQSFGICKSGRMMTMAVGGQDQELVP